jgi:hypothetical protein
MKTDNQICVIVNACIVGFLGALYLIHRTYPDKPWDTFLWAGACGLVILIVALCLADAALEAIRERRSTRR